MARSSHAPPKHDQPGDAIRKAGEVTALRFQDRADAGRQLAAKLGRFKRSHPIVLALPRGGVPVAAEIARALSARLDLLIVRKIGVPYQPELAMGAVVDGAQPIVVRNEDVIASTGVSDREFDVVRDQELAEIRRRRARYLAGRTPADVAGRTVIVVDDGIATGATMLAALRALRKRRPRRLVLAVPVAPLEAVDHMRAEADDVFCLLPQRALGAIGYYYDDFGQTSDEEVVEALAGLSAEGSETPPDSTNVS